MKKYKLEYIGIGAIILVPVILYIMMYKMDITFFREGENSDWLGFWGGYLGAIFGIFGAVFLSRREVTNQKEQQAQFLVITLYLEKMEKIQEYLYEIEAQCGDIYSSLIDLQTSYLSNTEDEQKLTRNLFEELKVVQQKLIKFKTLYSYFSGSDEVFINMNYSFKDLMSSYTELVMRRDLDIEKVYQSLDNFEQKVGVVQSFVTREITLKLIAVQSNYANPEDFVVDKKEKAPSNEDATARK